MKTPLFLLSILLCLVPVKADVIVGNASSKEAANPVLPEGERRIRGGIVILGKMCQIMAEINSHETAEASVPKLMRLLEEMQAWTQSFSNLPPLSEPEALAYEERYLPAIRKINSIIEAHAARVAAAEYYGSRNLPAVLVRFAQLGQP
ncbi:MAG: hypothetical protein J6R92_07525 [Akkermansia sp.]|nr:hypothetical protein [Akkermansia sp.]